MTREMQRHSRLIRRKEVLPTAHQHIHPSIPHPVSTDFDLSQFQTDRPYNRTVQKIDLTTVLYNDDFSNGDWNGLNAQFKYSNHHHHQHNHHQAEITNYYTHTTNYHFLQRPCILHYSTHAIPLEHHSLQSTCYRLVPTTLQICIIQTKEKS